MSQCVHSIQHWMNALALNASPVFVILCKYKFATFGVLGELPQWGVPVGFMGEGSERGGAWWGVSILDIQILANRSKFQSFDSYFP